MPPAYRGSDETALQSRRRSIQSATPQGAKAKAPRCVQNCASSSAPVQDAEVARLTSELNEAVEQQTATAEVLHLMSGSHGDLARVFDTILANATRLCQANFGLMHLHEGDAVRTVAMHNAPSAFAKLRRRKPVIRARPLLRMAATKQVIHIADITKDEASRQRDPDLAAFIELTGVLNHWNTDAQRR